MGKYAADTSVSASATRVEIERTLTRYGADAFSYLQAPGVGAISFQMNGRQVRLVVRLPAQGSKEFTLTPGRRLQRSEAEALRFWEKACRQRWRALLLLVKAQLEAIESGIISFEDAWLPFTVLPSGRTVVEEIGPQIEAAYSSGAVAPLQIERR